MPLYNWNRECNHLFIRPLRERYPFFPMQGGRETPPSLWIMERTSLSSPVAVCELSFTLHLSFIPLWYVFGFVLCRHTRKKNELFDYHNIELCYWKHWTHLCIVSYWQRLWDEWYLNACKIKERKDSWACLFHQLFVRCSCSVTK